ncbi:hypothetical protein GCM10007386_50460 [Pseudoduganella dura]|nr:hypothetical protein GCM10007386_50460 [Pseudoduganella dura]
MGPKSGAVAGAGAGVAAAGTPAPAMSATVANRAAQRVVDIVAAVDISIPISLLWMLRLVEPGVTAAEPRGEWNEINTGLMGLMIN